jgi:hypothetical protein
MSNGNGQAVTNGTPDKAAWVGDPWERQPGESDKAFLGFRIYRDMGVNRTVVDAEKQYRVMTGGSPPAGRDPTGQFNAWCVAHRWRERVSHWDDEQDAIAVREMKRSRIKMAERHAAQLEAAQQAMFAPVEELLRRMVAGRLDLSDVEDKDLLVLVRQVVGPLPEFQKAERTARGVGNDESPDVFLFGAIAQRSIDGHLENLEARVVQMNALPNGSEPIEGEVVE